MQKGIELAGRDFRNEIIGLINCSGLPPTLIGYILRDAIKEVDIIARSMIEKEEKEYQDELDGEEKRAIAGNKKKGEK